MHALSTIIDPIKLRKEIYRIIVERSIQVNSRKQATGLSYPALQRIMGTRILGYKTQWKLNDIGIKLSSIIPDIIVKE